MYTCNYLLIFTNNNDQSFIMVLNLIRVTFKCSNIHKYLSVKYNSQRTEQIHFKVYFRRHGQKIESGF